MANPNLTDMTEEDAADLQFPKGKFTCVIKHKINSWYSNITSFTFDFWCY